MTDALKLQLTLPALERLIGGDTEAEVVLRKQVARELIQKHFKSLADEEMWRLSHAMTEQIAAAVEEVVEGYTSGRKEPTGRASWCFDKYPHDKFIAMIEAALERVIGQKVDRVIREFLKANYQGDVGGDDKLQRIVEGKVNGALRDRVGKLVQAEIDRREESLKDRLRQISEEAAASMKDHAKQILDNGG